MLATIVNTPNHHSALSYQRASRSVRKNTDISEVGMDLKSQIQSTFKLSGLTVRIEASKYLAGLLGPVPDEDR